MLGRGGFDPAATVLARQMQRVFLACSLSLGVCGVLSIHSLRHSLMLSVFPYPCCDTFAASSRLAVFEALCHLDCLQDLPTWIDRLQTDVENCAVHQNTQHLETVYWCYAPIDVVYMVYSDAYVMMCACVFVAVNKTRKVLAETSHNLETHHAAAAANQQTTWCHQDLSTQITWPWTVPQWPWLLRWLTWRLPVTLCSPMLLCRWLTDSNWRW